MEAATSDRLERIKLAMVSSGRMTPSEAFPDLFAGDGDEAEVDFDYSGVQWESPESVGEDEYDKVMAALRDNATFTTRDASGTTEGVNNQPIPLEPDDTEWV
jgi:hypothetical protein